VTNTIAASTPPREPATSRPEPRWLWAAVGIATIGALAARFVVPSPLWLD